MSGVPVTPVIPYVFCKIVLFGVIVTVALGEAPGSTLETLLVKECQVPGAASAIPPQSSTENNNSATRPMSRSCQPLRRLRLGGGPALPPPTAIPEVGTSTGTLAATAGLLPERCFQAAGAATAAAPGPSSGTSASANGNFF